MSNYHSQIGIYDEQGAGIEPDPFRQQDDWRLAGYSRTSTFDNEPTPLERMLWVNNDLEARLKLSEERIYFLVSELAKANARLGIVTYRTQP